MRSPTQPRLSVVVPTCHRPDTLSTCLERLDPRHQTLAGDAYEVIVTDDSRDEMSKNLVAAKFPWVRWVAGPRRGPAANRNAGSKIARGNWLVFTDDDCEPDGPWLQEYFRAVQENPQILVFEGRTCALGKRTRVDEEAPVNETGGYLWSCNFAVQKSAFEELGGFDESFPCSAVEDNDLRYRMVLAGYPMHFCAAAIVRHGWRKMRGTRFSIQHAKSVVYFWNKFPALAAKGNGGTAVHLARAFKNRIKVAIEIRSGRGLGRAIWLDSVHILASQWFFQTNPK